MVGTIQFTNGSANEGERSIRVATPEDPILLVPWSRMRELRPFPDEIRPLYAASLKLGISWIELGELLLQENPNDKSMNRSALYLCQLATQDLTLEPVPDMHWHRQLVDDAELTLTRLAEVPRSTRQLLPVATFGCVVSR
jgi:hypothetical protein